MRHVLFVAIACVAMPALSHGAIAAEGGVFQPEEDCRELANTTRCQGRVGGLAYIYNEVGGNQPGWIGLVAKVPEDDPGDISIVRGANTYVKCRKNPMDDSKICVLQSFSRDPASSDGLNKQIYGLIYRGDRAALTVCVGTNHFPGEPVRIRFDEAKALVTGSPEGGCFKPAESLAILKARKVTTEYQRFPYHTPVTGIGDTVGLAEALDLADFLLAKL